MARAVVVILLDDLVDAYGRLDDRARVWLHRQGVSFEAMLMYPGPLGLSRIQTRRDRLFDFDDDGQKAFVMPVVERSAVVDSLVVVDALAFRPSDPTTWWLRLGAASILGDVEALDPNHPARIHPTPLHWLAANGAGFVVLDWIGASHLLRLLTEDGPGVIFDRDDYDAAIELERLLIGTPRPRPRIFIQAAEKELETV